jgi:hypothetical protein
MLLEGVLVPLNDVLNKNAAGQDLRKGYQNRQYLPTTPVTMVSD